MFYTKELFISIIWKEVISMTIKLKTTKEIPIDKVSLDLHNPRFNDLLIKENRKNWDPQSIRDAIKKDGWENIYDSIEARGVTDPIWVIDNENGRFTVIEGNRRICVLEDLVERQKRKEVAPPPNVRYTHVLAHILPKSTSEIEKTLHRLTLQTGKKKWGPYNEAYAIVDLARRGLSPKKIAKQLSKKLKTIERELESYNIYTEYVGYLRKQNKTEEPSRYTYFQRAGDEVKEFFFKTVTDKKDYFNLITPLSDTTPARIPTVALKGGLYDFNIIAKDPKILKKFLADPTMTVLDALDLYNGVHSENEFPWLKKIPDLTKKIAELNKENINKIKNDQFRISELKTLYSALGKILKQ